MSKQYTAFGRTQSVTQWQRSPENIHKISVQSLRDRIKKGMSVENALRVKRAVGKQPEPGINRTVKERSESEDNIHSLSYSYILARVNNGWTLTEALEKPKGYRRTRAYPVVKNETRCASTQVREFNWPKVEREIINTLRDRINAVEKDTDTRRELLNIETVTLRRLTVNSGDTPGEYTPKQILSYLISNPSVYSLENFKSG